MKTTRTVNWVLKASLGSKLMPVLAFTCLLGCGTDGAGNSSSGIAANYDFNGFTQTVGAIITATGTISADPWANFSF